MTSSLVTSVFYSTTYHTEGGSTVYVTNTIIQSTYVTGYIMATGANYNSGNSNNNTDHHKMNIKAVVGGVVGGVVGVLIVGIVVLFAVRRYNRKREEDRMEKEYQEAIKPVEYTGTNINDILSISSNGSFSFVDKNNSGNGNTNTNGNGILDGANSSSNDFGDILRGGAPPKMSNPFDDSRRVSYGSVFYDEPRRNGGHVLTVVNPDQTDYEGVNFPPFFLPFFFADTSFLFLLLLGIFTTY